MKHIQHLEECSRDQVDRVIDYVNARFPISVKYDGSPAILFGRDRDGCWVSTKSYFNKTPVKLYNGYDINAKEKWATPLKEKLMQAWWDLLTISHYMTFGYVYHADLLYNKATGFADDKAYSIMRPNILGYVHPESFQKDPKSVYALHTMYDTDGNMLVPNLRDSHQIIFWNDFLTYQGDKIEPLRSEWRDEVTHIKHQIIENLDSQYRYSVMYQRTDSGMWHQGKNEGYVIKFDDFVVKLVNRNRFTELNNSPDIVRGFSSEKLSRRLVGQVSATN